MQVMIQYFFIIIFLDGFIPQITELNSNCVRLLCFSFSIHLHLNGIPDDSAIMNRGWMDQYNQIRNTVSLRSKAYLDLRNLTNTIH